MEEIANTMRRLQQEVALSTEPILWGYPQLLREALYTITAFDFENDLLRVHCNENGAVLSIWSPVGATINEFGLRIEDAQRVRWEWQVYGNPKAQPMLYFKEFWRTPDDISGKSNSHWNPKDVDRLVSKSKAAVLWVGLKRSA